MMFCLQNLHIQTSGLDTGVCNGSGNPAWNPVRATAVGRDAERNTVLAGHPKMFILLCNK